MSLDPGHTEKERDTGCRTLIPPPRLNRSLKAAALSARLRHGGWELRRRSQRWSFSVARDPNEGKIGPGLIKNTQFTREHDFFGTLRGQKTLRSRVNFVFDDEKSRKRLKI
jgi:hypothetical protein